MKKELERNYEVLTYDIATQADICNKALKRTWVDKKGNLCTLVDTVYGHKTFIEEYSKLLDLITQYKEYKNATNEKVS